MKFYNIKNPKEVVSLEQAVLKSIGDDGGLYFPVSFPKAKDISILQDKSVSFSEIVSFFTDIYFRDALSSEEREKLTKNLYTFSPKVENFEKNLSILELFHGPTLSFKDFGATYLARLLSIFSNRSQKKSVVLVATSGDTGSAVANGFLQATRC